jgi:hypothetical protein
MTPKDILKNDILFNSKNFHILDLQNIPESKEVMGIYFDFQYSNPGIRIFEETRFCPIKNNTLNCSFSI